MLKVSTVIPSTARDQFISVKQAYGKEMVFKPITVI